MVLVAVRRRWRGRADAPRRPPRLARSRHAPAGSGALAREPRRRDRPGRFAAAPGPGRPAARRRGANRRPGSDVAPPPCHYLSAGSRRPWTRWNGRCTVWWRDDDAGRDHPRLRRLLALARARDLPLALAVVPAWLEPAAVEAILDTPQATVLQHGIAHADRARPGEKKIELGGAAAADALEPGLVAGRERLARALRRAFPARPRPALEPDRRGRSRPAYRRSASPAFALRRAAPAAGAAGGQRPGRPRPLARGRRR